jgi:hypothetical protein
MNFLSNDMLAGVTANRTDPVMIDAQADPMPFLRKTCTVRPFHGSPVNLGIPLLI